MRPSTSSRPLAALPLALCLLGATALAGCSSTRAAAVWRDPARKGAFTKLLVGVAGTSETARRAGEDALVARLPPGAAVASYQVVPAGQERDVERVKALLAAQGFDGVLVARLAGVETEVTRSSMPSAVTVYGYWGWAYTATYDQQVVDLRKVVRVESKLYDLALEQPVWSMVTETVDPASRAQTTDEVADLVVRKLEAGGLLAR